MHISPGGASTQRKGHSPGCSFIMDCGATLRTALEVVDASAAFLLWLLLFNT